MVKAQTAIAIMTTVALLIVSGAWYTNRQEDNDPGPPVTRYAAAPTEEAGEQRNLGMQESSPAGTPNLNENVDASWWTWPANDGCDAEAYFRSESAEADYPERAYHPLGTPTREDAEAAARVMRSAQSCGLPYTVESLLTKRAYEERIVEEDLSVVFAKQAEEIGQGRAISEAYPIQDPQEFGRLTNEEPVPATPSAMERWTGGPPSVKRYEPYSPVAIPSQAVLLPDGRIAIPESLIGLEGDEALSSRGAPESWPLHISMLVVLSDASGQWLVDDVLPFCVGDCDGFWSEQETIAEQLRASATEEAGVDATPVATPEEDAFWWTWPSGEECQRDELPEDTLHPADYPERAYLPLGTPDREEAEAAAGVARMMAACNVHYSIAPFPSSRYYEENYVLGEDPYDYGQTLLEQNENGRAISEAFPITDPTEFGRLTTEGPAEEPPFWIQGQLQVNRYDPFTVVYIPSQAVELADGRIAIPESLLGMEEDMDQARQGDPATWVRHHSILVVLSDASGTWHIDEILPFCIGPDCDFYWEQNEETAYRILAGATPEAPTETPAATPQAIAPIDDRIWLACPADNGPYTYASRTGISSDVAVSASFNPRSSWAPAEPPTIPCTFPGPVPPDGVTPVPLD